MALFGAKVKKVSFQDSSPRIRTYSLESDELYNRRQSVNEEILKKLRLRAGTENMISALG